MTKCGVTCCVLVPTPKSANKKGVKSYRAFIWTMFSLMLVTYLTCVPMTFTFTVGGIIIPVGVLSIIFSAMFTPGCKTTKQLRKRHPEYALKLSKYVTISWALGLSTFITSICAGSMFYDDYLYYSYGGFYKACLYGPYYDLSTYRDYDSPSGMAYNLDWNYDYDCVVVMGGFVFSIITSVLAAIQLIFIPCCLYLQFHVMDEVKKTLSVGDSSNQGGMDVEGYGVQPQLIDSNPESWGEGRKNKKDKKDKKNKKNKNKNMVDEMQANDPRVEQLVFAIQGMAGQIKNLQDGLQVKSQQQQQQQVQVQPQQYQSLQPLQPQQQVSQPLIFPQLNALQ